MVKQNQALGPAVAAFTQDDLVQRWKEITAAFDAANIPVDMLSIGALVVATVQLQARLAQLGFAFAFETQPSTEDAFAQFGDNISVH